MSIEEYWMGKGLNLDEAWKNFDDGTGYIQKVSGMKLHLLRLTFRNHPVHLPLFDHEVIYKTVKGTFHDIKQDCFSPQEYDSMVPIFLYRIDRGSGIFEFLGQFDPVITWVVALSAVSLWYRKVIAQDQDIDEKRLKFIRENFPEASNDDISAYVKAWTTFGRRRVLHRLFKQGLYRIEVSKNPIEASKLKQPLDMVDIPDISEKKGSE